MGAFLDKPKTEKHSAHGDGNGLRYGLSSMQGWRVEMEDAHTAVVGLPHGLADWSFFAVYDGHAGSRVANYCSGHLLEHILSGGTDFGSNPCSVEGVKDGIRSGFLNIDEYMRSFSDLRQGLDRSGSTAVCVLLSPSHLYFINCGDSRAVLCRDGTVGFSTQDHKPNNPREKERIQKAGGSVMIQRVNGSLAVSRALGDYDYKCVDGKGPTEQLVSPEPEVCVLERVDEGDEFIVLACDGIWDVMSNEELCEFVRSRLMVCEDLEKICNAVVDTCLHKGSRDNMSVVLVCLPGAPKVSDEALKKEEELDKYLESRVQDAALSRLCTTSSTLIEKRKGPPATWKTPGSVARKPPVLSRLLGKQRPEEEARLLSLSLSLHRAVSIFHTVTDRKQKRRRRRRQQTCKQTEQMTCVWPGERVTCEC
uniref:protein-serine/threonine phosphatase n=1 Tax=Neogobius melanostomus TaxID=47308 RepID=A0A8C6U0X4_9GOBI